MTLAEWLHEEVGRSILITPAADIDEKLGAVARPGMVTFTLFAKKPGIACSVSVIDMVLNEGGMIGRVALEQIEGILNEV